jgi:hypothetical protein
MGLKKVVWDCQDVSSIMNHAAVETSVAETNPEASRGTISSKNNVRLESTAAALNFEPC